MPRQSKGARLELRPERRDRGGKLTHHATWRIRDGNCDGCDRLVTVVTVWWPNFFATVRQPCPR